MSRNYICLEFVQQCDKSLLIEQLSLVDPFTRMYLSVIQKTGYFEVHSGSHASAAALEAHYKLVSVIYYYISLTGSRMYFSMGSEINK